MPSLHELLKYCIVLPILHMNIGKVLLVNNFLEIRDWHEIIKIFQDNSKHSQIHIS